MPAVAHINKDQAAEIATTIDPTTQSDFLAHVGQIQLPAIFSTHTLSFYTADAAPGYCALSRGCYLINSTCYPV